MVIKQSIKKIIPEKVLNYRNEFIFKRNLRKHDSVFHNKNPRHIFSEIYSKDMWGKPEDKNSSFSSGHGSHLECHVGPYVKAVSEFLEELGAPQNIVDIGCGDFNVGKQIRPYCQKYTACDVVPDLIRRNQKKFKSLHVDFRCIDITEAPLPEGDVLIIRQVLQHLSNRHIEQVVGKISGFKWLILTEFIPSGNFIPNLDQPTGSYSRLARGINSGIVLTQEPFLLKTKFEKVICETPEGAGDVSTIVYEL